MTQYLPIFIASVFYTCLVLLCLWGLGLLIWFLFGDMILHHLRVREVRKKWKK